MSSFNDSTPGQQVSSPMTNLANTLGTTLTVRRKLTLSESSDTPKKCFDFDRNGSPGIENNRLFKGNSRSINDSPLKCLIFQKHLNSPIEKENSSKCLDFMSKTLSPTCASPTFTMHSRHARGRNPLEDHDPNSQDSGFFSVPSEDSRSLNKLLEVGEKRTSSDVLRSESSTPYSPIEDVFLDNAVSPARLSQNSLPPDFNALIDGDIFSQTSPNIKPIVKRRNVRHSSSDTPRKSEPKFEDLKNNDGVVRKRKLTIEHEATTPEPSVTSKKARPSICLSMSFDSPRLENMNISLTAPVSSKKSTLFHYGFCKKEVPKIRRSLSTSEAWIKAAFDKEDTGEVLIGDKSRSFVLPLLSGRHADLRSISTDTLAQLLEGAYDDCIDSYIIIDCRYPYEFEGGHIRGAINIFTKEQLLQFYMEDKLGKQSPKTDGVVGKRNILIFHCEFSSERGPNLSRYLRNADRKKNAYPFLDYPEMYLLDGGYCKFFKQYSQLCEPSCYRMMLDPAHSKELRLFRSKSKTWAGDGASTSRNVSKTTLKRLGF
ncbi:M-phase inducer phosphatase-like [Adelges cooleyi]|uniref:M-phase inducer phosphatase-like n=1 Tax=Adelges cooleyi TaxID=133065 RepID=UPI002180664B|nr:M-phase inducer phosphatase-like [Adelges cooleyi]